MEVGHGLGEVEARPVAEAGTWSGVSSLASIVVPISSLSSIVASISILASIVVPISRLASVIVSRLVSVIVSRHRARAARQAQPGVAHRHCHVSG